MFEHIDEQVNTALEDQGTFNPLPAPAAAPPADPTDQPKPAAPTVAAEPTALERANAELAALKTERAAERLALESALAEQRLKTVAAAARKPSEKLNTAMQDTQVAQAIRAAKGPAFWNRFTEQQKAAALGIPDTTGIKDSLVKQFFGPTSNSLAAAQLGNNDPAQYQRLRLVAKLRRIL